MCSHFAVEYESKCVRFELHYNFDTTFREEFEFT